MEENKLEFNIYDMLVFEESDGSIYQDCVQSIAKYDSMFDIVPFIIDYEYDEVVRCCNFRIDLYQGKIKQIINFQKFDGKLIEIWTKTDEDTYKRVSKLK